MSGKKKLLAAALILMILAASAAGLLWHREHYYIIDFRLYPKDAQTLDLRGESISAAHYDKLKTRLPDCRIQWDVPFQDGTLPEDTWSLTVSELTAGDIRALAYFPKLTTVDANGCRDYPRLMELRQLRPDLEVCYSVTVSGKEWPEDTQQLVVTEITEQEIAHLQYLPLLETVLVEQVGEGAQLAALAAVCEERGISCQIRLCGEVFDRDTESVTLDGVSAEDLQMLSLLPRLKAVHLTAPQGTADDLYAFMEGNPELQVTWEAELFGTLYPGETTQLDLTEALFPEGALTLQMAQKAPVQGARDEVLYQFATDSDYPLPDRSGDTADLIAQVEEAAAFFPNLEEVALCGALLDNEAMAAFREAHREDYKVIWNVQCGGMTVRTDSPYFMPTKYHVYYFQDHESGNLKYCEDMICVDLGHMSIKHVEWAAYMPKLQYLVLAHTDVRSIEPLRACKALKFLELDWGANKSYEPLKDCTALEDLNLGNTYGDYSPIQEMTWLKNIWMIGCSSGSIHRMRQALPEVNIVSAGAATVDSGWRDLDNYYAMRDIMGMYYMSW